MGRELWEIVRAEELNVGDVVLDLRGGAIESYEIDAELVEIAKGSPKNFYPPKLRRVDPADDPRVLRLAIDNMMEHQAMTNTLVCSVEDWIEDARRELESEGRNELQG